MITASIISGIVIYLLVGFVIGVKTMGPIAVPIESFMDRASAGWIIFMVALIWPVLGIAWVFGQLLRLIGDGAS